MYIIGDVHGRWKDYRKIINLINDESIQIGDMGVGFPGWDHREWPKRHMFFPGNHDSPAICHQHPNCLGRYGYLHDHDVYYISGAYSIDKHIRTPEFDWWEKEELSENDFKTILEDVKKYKPKIILSHDAPENAILEIFKPKPLYRNRTSVGLQAIFDAHQPELWIFGHWHIAKQHKINNTVFICLGELEFLKLPNIKGE